jgi:hypothetical protein
MQNKTTRTQIAVGWLKEYKNKKTGETVEYISASASKERQGVKLMVEDDKGTVHTVDSFAVYFNSNAENPKAPHVTFVANLEE